jgi:hypothetical protein
MKYSIENVTIQFNSITPTQKAMQKGILYPAHPTHAKYMRYEIKKGKE